MSNARIIKALENLPLIFSAEIEHAMERAQVRAAKHAKQHHPYHNITGELERKTRPGRKIRQGKVFIGEVAAYKHYAPYIEKGVPPHQRISKTGKVFTHPGLPSPSHPGYPSLAFLEPAVEATKEETKEDFRKAFRTAKNRLGLR